MPYCHSALARPTPQTIPIVHSALKTKFILTDPGAVSEGEGKSKQQDKLWKVTVVPNVSSMFGLSPTVFPWVSKDWANLYYKEVLVKGTTLVQVIGRFEKSTVCSIAFCQAAQTICWYLITHTPGWAKGH